MEQVGACSQTVQLKLARLVQAEAKITDFLAGVQYVKNAMASAKLSCFKQRKIFLNYNLIIKTARCLFAGTAQQGSAKLIT
jgi:hypothetical protein